MTREETKEAIRIMQAYVDGKQIQVRNGMGWRNCLEPTWAWYGTTFRIAPDQEEPKEKHYRPYTMEEFVQEMHKHDGFIKARAFDKYGVSVIFIGRDFIRITIGHSIENHSYRELSNYFVWSDDGTPCGKEVTE